MYLIYGHSGIGGVSVAASSTAKAMILSDELERRSFTTSVFDESGREHSRQELRMEASSDTAPQAGALS